MIYRNGEIKIAHFAHEKNYECDDIYSESETEEHMNGKRALYEWLKKQANVKNLKLEAWIPETKQRPDLYFEVENNRYVIEFQCTPIATEYLQRHRLYDLAGIKDIWILGTRGYNLYFSEYREVSHSTRLKAIEKHTNLYLNVDNNNFILTDKVILNYYKPEYYNIPSYTSHSLNNSILTMDCPYIKLDNSIIENFMKKDNEVKQRLEDEKRVQEEKRKIEEQKTRKIQDLVDKLNERYKHVNGVDEFYMSTGWGGYYLYSITCDNYYNRLVFYINSDHTDLTEEYTYTVPFRGKRGGIGWDRRKGHSKISTHNHNLLDTKSIENFIINSLTDFLRKKKYPDYFTKEEFND